MDSLYVRYSSALISLASEENKVKEYKEAIKELQNLFAENNDVNLYLKSYFVNEDEKLKIIHSLCEPFKLSSLEGFMALLVKKHRFSNFNHIASQFIGDCNEILGVAEGIIYSTYLLDKKDISRIEDSIGKRLNQKVELINHIDSRLIGGVKVVVHDHVYDGSIQNKIETMKTKLNERRD